MRDRDYEGRPAHRRRTRVNVWRYRNGDKRSFGVQLGIENKNIWLAPEKA